MQAVTDWTRTNRNWFAAVQLEKRLMFIILTLIVAVAAFNIVSATIAQEFERIAQFRNRPVMASPLAYLERHESDLDNYRNKGASLVERAVERATDHAHRLAAQLRTLSPQNTLDRGYAIVRGPKGAIISSAASVSTLILARRSRRSIQAASPTRPKIGSRADLADGNGMALLSAM